MSSAGAGDASPDRIPLEEIEAAAGRIEGLVRRTPLERSEWLSGLAGAPVHLKLECWQRTRSFKLRGAFNAIAHLDPGARGRGLVAASAGNHGLGVALAARELDAHATIYVPSDAAETKRRRIAALGADLRLVEAGYDEAEAIAAAAARESGAVFVHAYDDPAVVAGQGTVGLEILEDLPDVGTIVVPVGGGGLIAGVGAALRGRASHARLVGVQSVATNAMHAAFAAGGPVELEYGPTLADGLSGGVTALSYRRARDVTEEIVLVTEARIREAVRLLYTEDGVVAEGSAAVVVAAMLDGLRCDGPIALVISGGNIDARKLGAILQGG